MERVPEIKVWYEAGCRSHTTETPIVVVARFNVCREGEGDGSFQKEVGWNVGCGDKARFWEDVWVGNTNLKTLYPRLFSLSLNKGQKVGEVGVWEESVGRWKLRWKRDRFEWEIPFETDLRIHISRVSVIKDENDRQVWKRGESGRFTVRSAYECIEEIGRGPQISGFGYLWKIKAFPNMMVTAWRVLWGRIPTREGLSRRGVMMNSVACSLCQSEEESCQHLFLECEHAWRVWALCFRWVGILSVQHNNLMINFERFHLVQCTNKQNLVWKGVWATVVRCMWEHRNSIVFNQGVVDAEEVLQNAQLKTWLWMKHKAHNFNYSFADWILNPLPCISSVK